MIIEILEVFRNASVAIVESGVETASIVAKAIIDATIILRDGASSASPAELFIVLVIFGGALYYTYRFFWDSAKTVVFVALILLTFLALFLASFSG